jgi:predicted 2-oxoglutarate/Fe(II)-dependent dioxygenase YbiX
MSTIEDYIYVENHIPVEICESLIDECNKKEWKKHTWNNYATGTFESEETKELDVMPCTQEQQNKITPYLVKALDKYQEKHSVPGDKTQGPWLTKFSPIRFNRYVVGTMMREHYDHIHSIFDGKMKGVPIVSIVANLNEDYEGSEFYCRGKEIKLKTGDILLFPSNFMYPHEVKEATKGVRYSFVSWAF